MPYKIVRLYFGEEPPKTIKTGLTLDEAMKHCGDPETSSRTCSAPTEGQWFDSFQEYKE